MPAGHRVRDRVVTGPVLLELEERGDVGRAVGRVARRVVGILDGRPRHDEEHRANPDRQEIAQDRLDAVGLLLEDEDVA